MLRLLDGIARSLGSPAPLIRRAQSRRASDRTPDCHNWDMTGALQNDMPILLRRRGRLALATVMILVILVGLYLGYVVVRRSQPVTLPAPTGPYQVGRVTYDWTDDARPDPLAPRPGRARELSVWMWYPAPPDAKGTRTAYAPGPWR